jgi:phosphoenolpyruvate-protein kinase (PTS system EI component)
MTSLVGLGAAPGTAVAPSWRGDRPLPPAVRVGPDEVVAAFAAVADDLDRLAARARAQGRTVAADIVGVGALLARDTMLVDAARTAGSAVAVVAAVDEQAAVLESIPDPELRERATDVRQVGRRVAAHLAGAAGPPATGFVLVAAEIGPADLLEHLGSGLVAAAAVRGGANSHAAIIARSVGLPLVTGLDAALLDLPDGTALLVDADAGAVVVDPQVVPVATPAPAAERGQPHRTADGEAFTLMCNVASDIEVSLGRDALADGIGLLRTELPFLDATRWPTEAEHRRALRPVLAPAADWPAIVRLLDFGGDKVPPFLSGGQTGLAALLAASGALVDQVRAILDVGRDTDLQIMVPMVTSGEDLVAVRAVVRAAAADLAVRVPPVGAMIETLAAAAAPAQIACDFYSIGTNDLVSAVLALDRLDPAARPELAADPRILSLVGQVVTAGRTLGTPVSVCGDAAAHPLTLALLVGAGIRTVSVACARVDETRRVLRRLRTDECRVWYDEACRMASADEVLARMSRRLV